MSGELLARTIMHLARDASVEINVQDIMHLEASRAFLAPGKKMYVSHLPRQRWSETGSACRAVHAAGFDPVPHIPVRLLADPASLHRLLDDLVRHAQVREVLLIAGDYAKAVGPYSTVVDVLCSGLLDQHGLRRVSFAGHPEGHPTVALDEIRRAELEKTVLASRLRLEVTLLTQFFFESAPFLRWAHEMRSRNAHARLIGGLAGPANFATLFRFATRCGVGPSIRALGARPVSLMKLAGDHGPEMVLRELAAASGNDTRAFDGIHLFCFGGFLRTCEWLYSIAQGHFALHDHVGLQRMQSS
jgi:methylenetetrahydrofolate reductase (NADPH)